MSIAILGWGSLLWDLDDLAPKVQGPWLTGHGPRLPMEFSRISVKRKMGLTVCLDVVHGVPCTTHVIASRRRCVLRAVIDLARRERTLPAYIGMVEPARGLRRGASPAVVETIAAWCRATGWNGAVWTGLPSNFAEIRGTSFSIPAATGYLRSLRGESFVEAVRYMQNAPRFTDTPLRRHLAGEAWWQEAARSTAAD